MDNNSFINKGVNEKKHYFILAIQNVKAVVFYIWQKTVSIYLNVLNKALFGEYSYFKLFKFSVNSEALF